MAWHVRADQVQILLKHWQSWDINHLSRKSVPVFNYLLGKGMLSNIYSKPFLVHLWSIPIPSYLRTAGTSGPSFPFPLLRRCREQWSPLSLFLSKLDKHKILRCFSHDIPYSSFTSFVLLLWTQWRTFTFFNAEAKNRTQ